MLNPKLIKKQRKAIEHAIIFNRLHFYDMNINRMPIITIIYLTFRIQWKKLFGKTFIIILNWL